MSSVDSVSPQYRGLIWKKCTSPSPTIRNHKYKWHIKNKNIGTAQKFKKTLNHQVSKQRHQGGADAIREQRVSDTNSVVRTQSVMYGGQRAESWAKLESAYHK